MRLNDFKGVAIIIDGLGYHAESIKDVVDIIEDNYLADGEFPVVHVGIVGKTGMNARDMIEEYLERYCDEYEDQDERCFEEFEAKDFDEIQSILDKVASSTVFNYYEQGEEIEYTDLKSEIAGGNYD